ncbi:DUF4391 domain-containing protein [Desulfobacter postgatei]|uniref:DUF4391 domain-containing protein n=1 Tax=Desulfobacter postgatei TaxID=2293 RepID=UPI00259AF33A|nr:DUF4391 domain-containing protein [uncultured Desulfobacter sp.]
MPDNKKAAIDYVWSAISFPEAAYLHKRMPKKIFLENISLVGAKNFLPLLRENVKNVYWEYTLKPSTCPVLPYRDNEREYLEVAVLQVEMNSQKGHKRIAEIINRVIPYPLMLGLYTETGEFALSIAPKRFSQTEHGAFVAERFYTTGWMNSEALGNQESAFVASLAWSHMPLQTYGTLYNAWVDRFTGYECSVLSGTFTIGKAGDRLDRLTRCREIESKISELRGQLKKAAFNRQVELNTQIKQMERELAGMVMKL